LQLHVANTEMIAIMQLMQQYNATYTFCLMLWQYLLADIGQNVKHLPVAVYVEWFGRLKLQSHAHHPYHTENMVGVRVGNEQVMYVLALNSSLLKLLKDSVATSSVHHQLTSLTTQDKAGVVTPCCQGIACAKEYDVCLFAHSKVCF